MEISVKGNLTSQKNFLCDIAGYGFVSEFVPRYFQAFEHDRVYLKGNFILIYIYFLCYINYILLQIFIIQSQF